MIHDLTTSFVAGGPATGDERDRLAKILDEYLLGLERGEPVEPEELLARHPEVAERLRGYLSGLALFHKAISAGPPHSTDAVLGGADLGAVLGDFRLVGEIGRGGMGVVYEAIQISLGRRVAVKVLPFSVAIDEKQIARFKHEAQSAAQIDHPHIVPVFAIGQERGIHFFAMQKIGGQSLAGLLDELRGDARLAAAAGNRAGSAASAGETLDHVLAVARMGVQAAEALDAAHEIGVVHRDIKPSNLLLDEKGKVWVTDFGVARCRSSPGLTETGHVVGSMPYMSPEQALGQSGLVDHRTDVYSLGVTLYELATLRHPCEGVPNAATLDEYGRAQWRRPSCWNGSIPVDFENIVLKAMAELRDERYATARELADDLVRFLDGKPVLARPPSLGSRVEKWARRHKRPVAAAMATLAVGVLGVIASLVVIASERTAKEAAYRAATKNQAVAEQNYRRAQAKLHQAREVLDRFGVRVNELLANELPGAEGVRRELLGEMLPYYRDFAREAAHDPALQADLALAYSKIGYLSDQLGAQADAERAYREARAILQRLAQAQPAKFEHQRSLALCCNNLGQVLQQRGETAAAQEELERALTIQRQLAGHSPLADEIRADLATTQNNLGLLFSQRGDKQRAAEHYRAAIEIQESKRGTAPHDEGNLFGLAASYNNLSSLYLPAQPAVATQWVEKALKLQLTLVKENAGRRDYQSNLALSYSNLGVIHTRLARWSDAELCLRDAITIQERLVAAAPLVTAFQSDLAVAYNNLGMCQTNAGALDKAEISFGQALVIQKDLVEQQSHDASLLSGLGGIYNNLGMVHQQEGELEAAAAAVQLAIAAQQEAHRRSPGNVRVREALSKHYYNQAGVLRELDRPAEAAALVLERRKLWPADSKRLLRIADELAALCNELPAGEIRERYLHEASAAIDQAKKSGRADPPRAQASPFDVLHELRADGSQSSVP